MNCDDERIQPLCLREPGNQQAQQKNAGDECEPEFDDGIPMTCAEMAAELKGLLSGEIPLDIYIARQAALSKAGSDEQQGRSPVDKPTGRWEPEDFEVGSRYSDLPEMESIIANETII
jgi:hypothetical protein